MARTVNLNLPEISPGEVNGDVTHNEGLWITDVHGQSIVEERIATPPGAPAEGQAWIIAPSATGIWAGKDNQVAHFYGGIWNYYTASEGWRFYSKADKFIFIFTGTIWESFSNPGCYLGGTVDPFTLNATDSKLVNYSLSDEWEWEDQNDINPTAGEIIIPKTGYYTFTSFVIGTRTESTKEVDVVLKLDIVGGPSPGRINIAFSHVATDKGANATQIGSTFTRYATAGEVLSLYMWADETLGTFSIYNSTFEISFKSEG